MVFGFGVIGSGFSWKRRGNTERKDMALPHWDGLG
jgi:hypothetical protein